MISTHVRILVINVYSGLEYLFLGSLAASSSYTVGVLVENLGREWFASQATP